MSDAIAAIATGNQVCAIGIVRLSGEGVIEMAQQLFTPERDRLCLCSRTGSSAMADSADGTALYWTCALPP